MNVYDHIDANNRKTVTILCAFPAALFATVFLFALLAAATQIFTYAAIGVRYIITPHNVLDYAARVLVKTGVVTQAWRSTLAVYPLLILAAFAWIWFSYRAGGSMILGIARARRVAPEENLELFRLVENTAIMAGLPAPRIYLIAGESMNAFAAGRSPETSSIAMTLGLVNKLDKAELQAVIAHELAHIGNRDTRLMQITVAGIGFFTFLGELLSGARGRRRGGGNLLVAAVGWACLLFGCVIAPLLRFALSRVREYQADAAGAKIVHDPDALARALYKIGKDPGVKYLNSAPLVGSMCIASPAAESGFIGFFSKLYAAHPPIEERIAALRNMARADTSPTGKASAAGAGRVVW